MISFPAAVEYLIRLDVVCFTIGYSASEGSSDLDDLSAFIEGPNGSRRTFDERIPNDVADAAWEEFRRVIEQHAYHWDHEEGSTGEATFDIVNRTWTFDHSQRRMEYDHREFVIGPNDAVISADPPFPVPEESGQVAYTSEGGESSSGPPAEAAPTGIVI